MNALLFPGSFQKLPGETEQDAEQRYKAYVSHWSAVKERVDVRLQFDHLVLLVVLF